MIMFKRFLTLLSMFLLVSGMKAAMGQSSSFTYQGRLQDGGVNANGSYDLQFTLWDSLSGGNQQPQPTPVTVTRTSVPIANGVFTVQLDFGANAFPGANRFLETSARLAGNGAFTVLVPRQQITSTPYAIRTLSAAEADTATNATQLGGVAAGNYVQTNDSRLTDARPPTAGSVNYIQNTTTQQPASNFNISGDGTAGGTLTASTLLLGSGGATARLSVRGAGAFNAAGAARFDLFNTTANTGFLQHVTDGGLWQLATTSGATRMVLDPSGNVGIQTVAPTGNLTVAQSTSGPGTIATVVGNNTITGTNTQFTNTFQLGDIIAAAGVPAGTTIVNINSDTSLTVSANSLATANNVSYTLNGGTRLVVKGNGHVGIGTNAPDQTLTVNGNASKSVGGTSWAVFSDERLKNIKGSFAPGLKALLQLQPIRYEYKPDNALGLPSGGEEVGFSAQAVAKVLPEAVSRSPQGYLQLHSDPILWTMLNAIKEQEQQIEQQQEQIKRKEAQMKQQQAAFAAQQQQLDALKALVCRSHRRASICR